MNKFGPVSFRFYRCSLQSVFPKAMHTALFRSWKTVRLVMERTGKNGNELETTGKKCFGTGKLWNILALSLAVAGCRWLSLYPCFSVRKELQQQVAEEAQVVEHEELMGPQVTTSDHKSHLGPMLKTRSVTSRE